MANQISFPFVILLLSISTQTYGYEFWDDLRIGWKFPNPTGWFNRLPRNTFDAVADGWVQRSPADDCTNGGAFNGFQWIRPSEKGVALLYDVNGFAGGIQTLVPQSEMLVTGSTFEFGLVPMYQNQTHDGVTYFVITAYFTEPENLCTENSNNKGNIGPWSQVYFQNGRGVKNLKPAYKRREDATANGWTVNNCAPGMGWHNFFAVETYKDYNCNRYQPTCILYNAQNEMLGFCFLYPGFTRSPVFEHPSLEAIQAVLGDTPQCLLDQASTLGYTTLHVYFDNAPFNIGCSK